MTLPLSNLLVCGTPGTGKTTVCKALESKLKLKRLNISELVIQHDLHEGYDDEFDTFIVDDDKLLAHVEPLLLQGGYIVESHIIDIFPDHFFNKVIVLRCDNSILYKRLSNRKYLQNKITENISAEIMEVILQEAMELYPNKVIACRNDSKSDLTRIVDDS